MSQGERFLFHKGKIGLGFFIINKNFRLQNIMFIQIVIYISSNKMFHSNHSIVVIKYSCLEKGLYVPQSSGTTNAVL